MLARLIPEWRPETFEDLCNMRKINALRQPELHPTREELAWALFSWVVAGSMLTIMTLLVLEILPIGIVWLGALVGLTIAGGYWYLIWYRRPPRELPGILDDIVSIPALIFNTIVGIMVSVFLGPLQIDFGRLSRSLPRKVR